MEEYFETNTFLQMSNFLRNHQNGEKSKYNRGTTIDKMNYRPCLEHDSTLFDSYFDFGPMRLRFDVLWVEYLNLVNKFWEN